MPNVMVIYDSQSGFTELMAKAVVEGVQEVKGIDVELLKVGTPFSVSRLESADAIILGSPAIYGNTTEWMKIFLDSLSCAKEANRINLSGKIGGVFGSYGWDGGWIVDMLSKEMEAFEIKIVAPAVSLVHGMYEKVQIDEKSVEICRELGRVIAEKC